MVLRFATVQYPDSTDALSDLQRIQLERAGELRDGQARSAEERLDPGGDEETSFAGMVEVWDVVDEAGAHVCDVWLFAMDSGAVFRAGTAEPIGRVVARQFVCDDPDLARALHEAVVRRPLQGRSGMPFGR